MRPPSYEQVVAMAKMAGYKFVEKWEGAHHKVEVWGPVSKNDKQALVKIAVMTRLEGGAWRHSFSMGPAGERMRSKGRMAMLLLERLIKENEGED